MEDKKHQDEVLAILAKAWKAGSHLRLCQLIFNAMIGHPEQRSFYDYEDDDLVERLIARYHLDVASIRSARADGSSEE